MFAGKIIIYYKKKKNLKKSNRGLKCEIYIIYFNMFIFNSIIKIMICKRKFV
jgi:hypothetical protein